jgi:hypothetical protein
VSRSRQGIYQTKRQTALLAHQQGMAIAMIAGITELSQEEVWEILRGAEHVQD